MKGVAVLLTVVGAPILGVVTTPKREAVAKAADSEEIVTVKPAPSTVATGNFIGVLLPPQMATISSYAEGRVDHIDVKVGQPVKKGELLLAFDPRESEQALAAAESGMKAAKAAAGAAWAEAAAARADAKRNNATIDYHGEKISLVAGGVAETSLHSAAAAAARAGSAGAQIAEAKARVEQLKLQLEHSEFRAPFDGVVTQINVEQGATAHAGQPIVRVVGGQGLRARIAIPEESAGVWQGRRRAQLQLDNKTYWAILDQVSPEVEPTSRTYFVEGPLAATPDGCGSNCALLAGRPVRATLISDKE
jgi:RND family efflux transporter MFP subunit